MTGSHVADPVAVHCAVIVPTSLTKRVRRRKGINITAVRNNSSRSTVSTTTRFRGGILSHRPPQPPEAAPVDDNPHQPKEVQACCHKRAPKHGDPETKHDSHEHSWIPFMAQRESGLTDTHPAGTAQQTGESLNRMPRRMRNTVRFSDIRHRACNIANCSSAD